MRTSIASAFVLLASLSLSGCCVNCPCSGPGVDASAPIDARATDSSPEDAPAARDAGPVPCGTRTCAAHEYCMIECLCCAIPDAGLPSAAYECRPFSRACDSRSMCECNEITELGGTCDPARRLVEIPCA